MIIGFLNRLPEFKCKINSRVFMRNIQLLISVLLFTVITGCTAKDSIPAGDKDILIRLRDEIVGDLKMNLLPFWKENSPDTEDPKHGFFGAIAYDGTGVPEAKKHNVLFTRYLWTYSAAGRVLEDQESLELAHRAYHYLAANFWDDINGGVFWELNADGTVSDSTKMTYGLSFAIYSFSEYYRVTQNEESLQKAVSLFHLIEEHVWDNEYGGYLEAFTADWKYLEGAGIAAGQSKSMNTHLHLLEAYTNLYRVWPDMELEKSIYSLIEIFKKYILNTETFHQELFFERDWTVYGRFDSFGHDIEFSWLFDEAGKVLKDPVLSRQIQELSLEIAKVQLLEGMNPYGAMIYEKEGDDHYRKNISWWVQAEAVVGFLNAYEISRDAEFLSAAFGVWNYIKENMIDRQHGGWYPDLDENGIPRPGRTKGDSWTGPYHNVRMGLEVYERLHDII
jgi:cellobiose epimerase